MRKKLTALMLLMVILLSCLLSGCHGAKESIAFEVPESFDTSRNYEITFWAKNDTNKTQVAIYNKAVEDFEALYPNITVTIKFYTDYSRIYSDVITNISTGTTPNVCITYPDNIATYKSGDGVVVPLDGLMADEKYGLGGTELEFDSPAKDEIVSQFLEECIIDGYYYALPFMRSTEALYINKTYVEALGYEIPDIVTWDFVWEVSEAAMAKGDDGNYLVNGQNVMIPFIYKSTDNMLITMLRQLGADYTEPNGAVTMYNDTTKEILKTIAEHVKTGAFSTFKISSYPANFLNAGQSIFAIDSTAGATWIGTDAPLLDISADKLVEFETVVRPVPQYDTENPLMISQGPSICIFNKEDPQEVLASWLFAQYLISNDVQIAYSETEGYVPVTEKAQNDPEYLDYLSREGEDNDEHYFVKLQAAKLLMDNTENTFVTNVFNGSASVRDAAGGLIESTAKSVRRKETVDDAYFEKLFSDSVSLYHLELNGSGSGKTDLGPLPATSKALLISIAAVWVLMGIAVIAKKTKNKDRR